MKKIHIFTGLLVCTLLLTSCSKNNDNPGQNQEQEQEQKEEQSENMGDERGMRREGEGMLPPEMDLSAAAEKLGITEEKLKEAMNLTNEEGRPNMELAAEELGITAEELREALGMPEGGMMREGSRSGMPKERSTQN